MSNCSDCSWFYYEKDTNYGECQEPNAQAKYTDEEDMALIKDCPFYFRLEVK